MQRWHLSFGLAATALAAALVAPRLYAAVTDAPMAVPPDSPVVSTLADLPAVEEPVAPVIAEVPVVEEPAAPDPTPRTIDLVIALDTSGSMDNLIDSTRARLWDIVNEIDAQDADAQLRVGLIAFGTPSYGAEKGFVRVVTPLTDNLDQLYSDAFALSTDGGDEYVGQVIDTAVRTLDWSPRDNPDNRRLLFVAGNETAKLGPIDPAISTMLAREQHVVVSTLFAGNENAGRSLGWADVAKRGAGQYLAIDASQSAVAVSTPYDQQLQVLNTQLNGTYVAYTEHGNKRLETVVDNDASAWSLGLGSGASRVASKGSAKYRVDSWDLVTKNADGDVDLAAIDRAQLPGELRSMDDATLEATLNERAQQRTTIQAQIQEVQNKRSAYIRDQAEAQAGEGLDEAMATALDALL